MSVGGFQEWALSQPVVPEHQLLGSVCICGGWSAQCGQDIAEQWRQHVNVAERVSTTPAQSDAEGARG